MRLSRNRVTDQVPSVQAVKLSQKTSRRMFFTRRRADFVVEESCHKFNHGCIHKGEDRLAPSEVAGQPVDMAAIAKLVQETVTARTAATAPKLRPTRKSELADVDPVVQ